MKEIDNQDLLNSIENYVQYLVITYNGKELKKGMHIYTYIYIYESLCCIPETNTICKSNMLQ